MGKVFRFVLVSSIAMLLGGPATALPAAGDADRDRQVFVDAMALRGTHRPVVAVLALNEGTEMTDLLLPTAVLRRADVADVVVVAPRAGDVALYPALRVRGAISFEDFARRYPAGASHVVVPAMVDDDDPAVTGWLRRQAASGARVIGVCSGVRVVGRAGLLDGRHFSGHWYDRRTLLERHPGAVHVPDRRYVVDGPVATTTGITASVPAMLALVEALGGQARASALAGELGVSDWGPSHDSEAFGLDTRRAFHYLVNKAAFWRGETLQVDVADGADDVALALVADAWVRTGHVSLVAVSDTAAVTLRSGLVLASSPPAAGRSRVPRDTALPPVRQLDRALCEIGERHGDARRDWVMQEMEYPMPEGGLCGR